MHRQKEDTIWRYSKKAATCLQAKEETSGKPTPMAPWTLGFQPPEL
jgi:hypothetical protein